MLFMFGFFYTAFRLRDWSTRLCIVVDLSLPLLNGGPLDEYIKGDFSILRDGRLGNF